MSNEDAPITTIHDLASRRDQAGEWRRLRQAIARKALLDDGWVAREQRRESLGDQYPERQGGTLPFVDPRISADAGSLRRRWGLSWNVRPSVANARERLSGLRRAGDAVGRIPTIIIAFAWAAMTTAAVMVTGSPARFSEAGAGAVMLVLSVAAMIGAGDLRRSIARNRYVTVRVLTRGAVLAAPAVILGVSTIVVSVAVLALCVAVVWSIERIAIRPLRTRSVPAAETTTWGITLAEGPDAAAGLLRTSAVLLGTRPAPADVVDTAAAVIAAEAWMYALGCSELERAPWYGPAATEAAAAILARAAGHGRDTSAMPGPVGSDEDFPSFPMFRAAMRVTAERLAPGNVDEVLRRAVSDLAGGYDDRVARVGRLLTS